MIELGLQRISRLLYNNPTPWRAIHVAGTNGKGSVCAYISEMLQVYNDSKYRAHRGHRRLRLGRFTSPHLVDRWDCISLSDGRSMKPVESDLFHEVEELVLKRNREADIRATEFELLTATAFEIFTQNALDVAVVEVGVGGRLDATNILGQPLVDEHGEPTIVRREDGDPMRRPRPLVTVITKIGMDHQGLLGNTITEIATEKAGICKPQVPLVFDSTNERQVTDVLERASPRWLYSRDCDPLFSQSLVAHHWQDHMRQNAMTASLATQVALGELGKLDSNDCAKPRTVDDVSSSSFTQRQFSSNLESLSLGDGRVKGDLPNEKSETPAKSENQRNTFQHLQNDMALAVSRLVFPGRQEWIDLSSVTGRKEQVLLDGAHNPQSAAVLKKKIAEMRSVAPDDEGLAGPPNPITWVVAMTRGKQVDDFFKELLDEGDNVVAVEFGPVDGMPWVEPTPAGELISAVRDVMPGLGTTRDCGKDLSSALETATKIAEDTHGQKLVIAGSLYLVGDTHRLLRKTSTPQFDVRRYDTRPGRRRAKR